ncbi:SDR family NAD(P)-dependent oxidoreductase [Oceanibacterium hippocampi]|uniref:3-oxoacyl-[acyl-carrier-protein] reductase FabG n=1 Tax=Oceanibacterium hippocampi TaxID=745714 RepID=A0A1Y5TX70_9PROT|nr:SDR family NAD(P)-dependent oxidoreductase [Oceanibacterium hippocampi]SLN75955.1 3-oxoacyl-[acyl-carrier-protein] reductase FabG [Oceanibacterium hippocampi]
MSGRLDGKVAVVTGGGAGIGRATVLRLAGDGARVLAVDRNVDDLAGLGEEARAGGLAVETLVRDVTDDDAPADIVKTARQTFSGFDILVNNAGIGGAHTAESTSDEEWDHFLDVNLRSLFRLSREAVRAMKATGGRIVNTASIFGLRGFPGTAAYSTSKAAVIGLTRQMASDCGIHGITVNAVAPGIITTAMTAEHLERSEWFRDQMVRATPAGRAGTPDDVARAIAFLVSDDAAYISGQILAVDGGWSASHYRPFPPRDGRRPGDDRL